MLAKILATRVTGKITLPAQTGKLQKFACANVTVVATSRDLLPHAPNEFGQPKWVRTGKAKMIAGQCRYSINVPPNSAFYLTAGGHGRGFACTSIDVFLTPTGASARTVRGPLWGAEDGESVGQEGDLQHARVITASAGRSHKATRRPRSRVWGCVSAIDSCGRTIWIADAHRGDGRRFVVHAEELLIAFLELEGAICACGELPRQAG